MIKKQIQRIFDRIKEKKAIKNLEAGNPGSPEWLIRTEIKFGGKIQGVKRNKVSPHDKRSQEALDTGGMIGGDRMLHHGYAEKYSQYLIPFVKGAKPINLAEVGILKGNGLALWCELFQDSVIMGFDIDLSHINNNRTHLEKKGAFSKNNPELFEYDQFLNNDAMLHDILKGRKVDVCVDDGLHTDETVLMTLKSFYPHLSKNFVYFIEDNSTVHNQIRDSYDDLNVDAFGELTILTRK